MNKEHSPDHDIRAWSIVGLGIFALALTVFVGGVWSILLIANLATSPAVPWAVLVMAILIWLIWQFLDGKGWPPGTSKVRHHYLRARLVARPVFLWSMAAGLLSIIALTGLWIVLFQLVKVPGNALPAFSKYPLFTVTLVLLMASLATSVIEEAGFRGYFQSALESKLGGFAAIMISALVISPGHSFTQGFVWPTMMFYFFVDAMFGVLAYLCDSILPGIVVHAIGLLIFFTWIWPFDANRRLVSEAGPDAWFWTHIAQTLIFTTLAFLAFRQLAKITNPANR
ncbi:MAG TPA: CPBP family intramembrane glutamic endopeptidase [Anaerolineales bacterium]|nr:CPBP family intramembrane glutamic endopeptidase [Anaerolineales bacterium]HLO33749.1 CPBP family intramembrane glutamic endopeptidase [Anaerolineales bacterium]